MKITDLVCFKSILVLRGKRVKGENEFVMLPLFSISVVIRRFSVGNFFHFRFSKNPEKFLL